MLKILLWCLLFSGACQSFVTPSWQRDAQRLLTQTLEGIGDVASARASTRLDEAIDGEEFIFSGQSVLTNVFESGSFSIKGDVYKAEVHYVSLLCVCHDADCTAQVAADLNGVVQIDRGDFVGYSPLFLLDGQGSKIPCLSIVEKDIQELHVQGCDLVNSSATTFYVRGCPGNNITEFEVLDRTSGSPIARPYNDYELLPDDISDTYDPTQTMGAVFGNIPVKETILRLDTVLEVAGFNVPISIEEDIGPLLSEAGGAVAMGIIDSVARVFLPTTFSASSPASNATVADIYRVLLNFSIFRLFRLVAPWEQIAVSTVSGDAVYGNLVAAQPDLIPIAAILSGITLLLVVTASLAYALATNRLLSVPVIGSFLVFGSECSAYVLRFSASLDLARWEESMMLVFTRASSRNYALILGGGLDGSGLAVTVAYVHLSNASDTYLWLQISGMVLTVLVFPFAFYWGRGKKEANGEDADRVDSYEAENLEVARRVDGDDGQVNPEPAEIEMPRRSNQAEY